MYTGYGMSILNCSHYNKTPLINSTSYSCGGWNVARPNRETNIFQLVNENTLYAVVKDASLAENATIWTWSSAETNNAKWVLTNVNISSEAPLKDGMYTIKNKNSGLYLTRAIPNYQSINIMQYPLVSNRVSVWYFKQEESGLYTIKNIDAMANMQVQNASLDDGADIIDQGTPDYGNVKWRIEPQSGTKYYKLFNFNSRKLAVIKDASKEPNAPLIQYSTGEDNALWEIEPYSYKVPQSISGMFWIKHVNSGWSLGIPGSSLSPDVEAEALSSAEGCNTWWSFNLLENGAYTIQNVNSQLYLDMKGATVEYLGIAIQYPRNEINNRGNSEWVLEPYSTEAGNRYFRIKNLHSGLYLAFLRDQTQLHDPVVQIIPQGLDDPKIKWELVPMQF